MRRLFLSSLLLLSIYLLSAFHTGSEIKGKKQPPNIIFILADDLGYGELGCFGQTKIHTPHLDQMAAEGMRLTQFYANTLCAPSRCSFLTGLSTLESQVRDNYEYGGYRDDDELGQMPLATQTQTVASVLQSAGYATACIGKWGLGGPGSTGVPNRQGFDLFYGYLDQKQAHNYYPSHLWRNEQAEALPNPWFMPHQNFSQKADSLSDAQAFSTRFAGSLYSGDTMTAEALKFIRTNRNRPFFLYLAYTLPHLALQAPDRAVAPYRGEFTDTPYYGQKGYLPCAHPRATYAGMISLLDNYVGQVLQTLKEQGLDDNTLVVFTSDNGATVPGTGGADTEFFHSNGPYRGWKGALYEGGIRVPMIARWPGKIKAGSASDHLSALWDMLPTFCAAAGIDRYDPPEGSISLLPVLLGKKGTQMHPFLYWEVHGYGKGIQAVRWGPWKALRFGVHENPEAPLALYNLENDPEEMTNLADAQPREIEKAMQLLRKRRLSGVKEWNFKPH